MERLSEVNILSGKIPPLFSKPIEKKCFGVPESNAASLENAKVADMAFLFQQQSCTKRTGWTEFNQKHSTTNPEITTVGYMPIIQAPAHEMDTLNTVVKRCMFVAEHLGQMYTVLTVDQALYYKLMQLKWLVPEYR